MNIYLGGFGLLDPTTGKFDADPRGGPPPFSTLGTIYLKYSDLANPGDSTVFLFLDERQDAINTGNFFADMTGFSPANPSAYMMADVPASYHGNAGGFSFTDGHAEIKPWLDGRTMPPLKPEGLIFNGNTETSVPGDVDINWLQYHSTR